MYVETILRNDFLDIRVLENFARNFLMTKQQPCKQQRTPKCGVRECARELVF